MCSRIFNSVQLNPVLEMSHYCTPRIQNVTVYVFKETRFALMRSYIFVATAKLGFLLFSRDQLYHELYCFDWWRLVLTFWRPFIWENVVIVDIYGRRLRDISQSWPLLALLLQIECSWDKNATHDSSEDWRRCGWGQDFVHRLNQALLRSLVAPSSSLYFVARVVLTQAHGMKEHLSQWVARIPILGRCCAEKCSEGNTAGCVVFLVEATELAQKIHFGLVEWQSVKRIVLHLVPDVLACDTDQKQSFFYQRQEQGSILEVWDAELSRSHLF